MTTKLLGEKDISLTTISVDKDAKSSPSEVVEDKVSIYPMKTIALNRLF